MRRYITSRRLLATLAASVFFYTCYHSLRHRSRYHQEAMSRQIGCMLPSIEPDPANFPPKNFKPVDCSHRGLLNPVRVLEDGLLYASVQNSTCSYANVTMVHDFRTKFEKTFHEINSTTIPCPSDVIVVRCRDQIWKNDTYNTILRCIARKPQVDARIAVKHAIIAPHFDERLNILMFGLDSVARVTWLEQMRNTTDLVSKLGAITFEGYNIVGDGTTAAILGLTTGYLEEELHESRRGYKGAQTVDDFPFIFKRLRDLAGYVTLWDEDGANVGTFQYRLMGFQNPPVDYYGRHFQLAFSDYPLASMCMGSISTFEEMVRQFRLLFSVYPDPVRKFVMAVNQRFTHTSETSGGQDAFRVDHILANEIKFLHENGHLNQSVLILFADHGSRFGGARASHRGKIAERMPYLTFIFPPWFQAKYKKEMKHFRAASKQLTTPFDLHATLLEIGGITAAEGTPKRGVSFFKPIPISRTCSDAGVLPHWCVCLATGADSVLKLDDALVLRSLLEFQRYVNDELLADQEANCEMIRAERPFSAQRLSIGSQVEQFVKTVDGHGRKPAFDAKQKSAGRIDYLQISFYTEPGGGQWEVTFSYKTAKDRIEVLPKQISRTNKYGSAPACIQDNFPHLRQFCYCKKQASA